MLGINLEVFSAQATINIPEGEFRVGSINDVFVSYDFSVCSAILLRGMDYRDFGFIHLYPGQEIDDLNLTAMASLCGGSAKVVEGSDNRYKVNLIRKIESRLRLNGVEFKEVDTASRYLRDKKFHVLYKPSKNQVTVARNSQSDYINLKAF